MKGGDSDADGLLVSSTNKNGKTTTEFVSPTIYYTTDDYYYIDSENVTAGDILVKPDSNETYRVGSDTATLKGVYNVNKGYAVFKQIDILYQSKEYTIVKTGTSYGISLYDHIALDGAKINDCLLYTSQGTMAENNVYRGLILRDETIVTSQYAGSLNLSLIHI